MKDCEKKIKAIQKYVADTREALDEAMERDGEYNTSTGNGVNSSEASSFFEEVEAEIEDILK